MKTSPHYTKQTKFTLSSEAFFQPLATLYNVLVCGIFNNLLCVDRSANGVIQAALATTNQNFY